MANNLKDVLSRINKNIDKLASVAELRLLGEEAIKFIRIRTRLGYGVRSHGSEKRKLKPLSKAYIKHRKRNRRALHGETSPTKSNLTYSGQLLDSLGLKKVTKAEVIISPMGRRRGGGPSNAKVGEYVTAQGRPFNFLTNLEIKKLSIYWRGRLAQLMRDLT